MKAKAVANSNIALVKYWGQRDSVLVLPNNSSISMTLDGLKTTSKVEFLGGIIKDEAKLNNKKVGGESLRRIERVLDLIRERADIEEKARIFSENNFPTSAGLASSASGFAALALAGSRAAGLELNERKLSILARRGSGSAARSVPGGFAEWHKGRKGDGSDSFAEKISEKDWGLRLIAAIVNRKEKAISSEEGHRYAKTSELYKCWLESVEADLDNVRKGIHEENFPLVGRTSEQNCIKMHAVMMSSNPSIFFWTPKTMEVINAVRTWRKEGLECYFTIDAGPNVKVLCMKENVGELRKMLLQLEGVEETIICGIGKGARFIESG